MTAQIELVSALKVHPFYSFLYVPTGRTYKSLMQWLNDIYTRGVCLYTKIVKILTIIK